MSTPRSFQIQPEDVEPGVRVLAVQGEADRFGTEAITAAVQEARDTGRDVVIDLNETTYIDSSMLSALVAASEQGRKTSQPLVILCAASRLRRSLELKGLQSILELADSRDHAIELLEDARNRPSPEPS
jgi:anti-sigma B factor antagonist